MYTRVILLFILVFMVVERAATEEAAADGEFSVFPSAETVATQLAGEVRQHLIASGEVKRVRTEYEPESALYIKGRLSSRTDRIHNQRNTKAIINHYRTEFAAELVFECQGRDCGSSNYWANSYFSKALLYGPERHQAYFLSHQSGGDYKMIYIAQRGTGAIYVHQVDIAIEGGALVESGETEQTNNIVQDKIGLALRMRGRHLMENPLQAPTFASLVAYLSGHPKQNLALVIHNAPTAGESIEAAFLRSESEAKVLKRRLVAAGVEVLSVYGLGPLAPDQQAKRNRIVLLRVD